MAIVPTARTAKECQAKQRRIDDSEEERGSAMRARIIDIAVAWCGRVIGEVDNANILERYWDRIERDQQSDVGHARPPGKTSGFCSANSARVEWRVKRGHQLFAQEAVGVHHKVE